MSGASRAPLIFLTASSILVAGVIAAGLWITPSPSRQRAIDLDRQEISDLTALAQAVLASQRASGKWPASLRTLPEAASLRLADAATGAEYEYILNDSKRFQLCAVFTTVSDRAVSSSPPEASGWKHQRGRQCFAFSTSPGATPRETQD
ncbi:hypothetical protein [Methylocapsa palsarum]|uniref:Type II secretory pathway, pseudopilin PulG n=1 Tax=Methylocapsa palsarum TaxID=1612308 RepID=A0A1I3ZRJ6_9HYPH|nr:hypothetical protein [Methylocapsa palsarum]SFK46784.1 hypothetical protein SAMN05444581_108134 [Methylocapsa palsarum]